MNDIIFCKNFRFNEFCYDKTVHRNNSHGVDFHYIGFMRHGKGRIITNDQVLEIDENEMFYIPKGLKYHSHWIAKDYVRFDSIGFLYFPSIESNGYDLQKIEYNSDILEAFMPLLTNKSINNITIGYLYHLLGLLEPILRPALICKKISIYERMTQLMQKNPQMTIPEYAALCGVSESFLYHSVKKVAEKTPNRIRQEILCKKAAELLVTTDYTIEEICDTLGFSSSAYFRKIFESIYEKSPSQMRKDGNVI